MDEKYEIELGWAKALEESIRAWSTRVSVPSIPGTDVCPLCLYTTDFYGASADCKEGGGCPVYRKTGEERCRDTPMVQYDQGSHRNELGEGKMNGPNSNIARDEVRFLKSCRSTLDLKSTLLAEETYRVSFRDKDGGRICTDVAIDFDKAIDSIRDKLDPDYGKFIGDVKSVIITIEK